MQNKTKGIKAIILSAGYSRRMDLRLPKQLLKIDDKPLLGYTLDAFERCPQIDGIILVVQRKFARQYKSLIKSFGYKKIEQLVIGGVTRQQSVFNALTTMPPCDYVMIHDGVRPFVSRKIILAVIKAVRQVAAVTSGVQAIDTIVEQSQGLISSVLCRDRLWHVQTPQAFKFDLILQAHHKARAQGLFDASDDAQLLLKLKKKVRLITGSYENRKITTKADLSLLTQLK